MLKRYEGNPILIPKKENEWEAKAVFNPAAIYLNDKIYLVYRAMSKKNVSSLGYARFSSDGYTLEERLPNPIYYSTEAFEMSNQKKDGDKHGNGNVGCEDPRITIIRDRIYMCYVAVDAVHDTRVAFTSIKKEDFLAKKWDWEKPILISPPGIGDKNSCVIPLKTGYAFFHRIYPGIWIDIRPSLKFQKEDWILGKFWIKPREGYWDSRKIGIAGPPVRIKKGWLLIYHGIAENGIYRLGAAILDRDDPRKVLKRCENPILELCLEGAEGHWQKTGQVPNAVFSCGQVAVENRLLVYYGIADAAIGLASCTLNRLIKCLIKNQI